MRSLLIPPAAFSSPKKLFSTSIDGSFSQSFPLILFRSLIFSGTVRRHLSQVEVNNLLHLTGSPVDYFHLTVSCTSYCTSSKKVWLFWCICKLMLPFSLDVWGRLLFCVFIKLHGPSRATLSSPLSFNFGLSLMYTAMLVVFNRASRTSNSL